MNLPLHRKLITAAGIFAAVPLGWELANGNFLIPGAVLALLGFFVLSRFTEVPVDATVAGAVALGYLLGNRGFAQLNVPGLPLLPGELALATGLVLGVVRTAFNKEIPVRRDALNLLLLAWIAFGSARVIIDVRVHGIIAVRDFAMVYYALFFFLAQRWATMPAAARWLRFCFTVGFAGVTPVTLIFNTWPEFVTRLTVAGIPLVFVKGDTAGAFMAAGVFWFGSRYAEARRWHWVALMALCGAGVLLSNNRAALIALLIGGGALVVLRERRIVKACAGFAVVTVLLLAIDAAWPRAAHRQSRAFLLYETALTMVDFSGTSAPKAEYLGDKPDNNRFRLVWWESVIHEARVTAPWLGLGFGHDLASQFLQRYYAGDNDEFNTRSPHNFLITVFARMGILGLAVFVAFLFMAALRTLRVARVLPDCGATGPWLASAMIVLTACLGVILEAPMGAVVFWLMLGLANGTDHEPSSVVLATPATSDEIASSAAASLPAPAHTSDTATAT